MFSTKSEFFNTHEYYLLDLNNDRIGDFYISQKFFFGSGGDGAADLVYAYPTRYGDYGSGVEIKDGFYAGAIVRGAQIGPRRKFQGSRPPLLASVSYETCCGTHTRGHWINAKHRFLGLKFLINGEMHYGWCRISVLQDGPPIYRLKVKITGYAYETQPNKPIVAGDKGTGAKSLGHLAVGAAERKHR